MSDTARGAARPALPSRLDSVQVMRGFAAAAVLMQHTFREARRFSDASAITDLDALPWHIGVDLFFIISGFIMMHTAGATFRQPHASRAFLTRRLIRIAPSYWIFTTLMIVAALILGDRLHTTRFEPLHALLSYLFVPHLRPGYADQINPILALGWTLVYEMFFYVVFALALRFDKEKGVAALAATFIALFTGARFGLFTPALNVFWSDSIMFAFLLGIGAHQALVAQRGRGEGALWALALAGIGLGLMTGSFWTERFLQLDLPALMIFLALYRARYGALQPLLVKLGDASYALYLGHPFVLTAGSLVFGAGGLGVLLGMATATWLYAAVCVAATFALAFVFFRFVETPMTRALMKSAFARRLLDPTAGAAPSPVAPRGAALP